MLSGLPDLSLPLLGVPGVAYQGFERNGLAVAVPDRLLLETESDGHPRLLLTLIRGGGAAATTAGWLELGLSMESDLAGIGQALADQGRPATLTVVEIEEGIFTLNASLGSLLPTLLAPPQLLPPDLLTRPRVVIDLNAEASVIAARLIEESTP